MFNHQDFRNLKDTNDYIKILQKTETYVSRLSLLRQLSYILCIVIFAIVLGWFIYNIVMKSLFWDRSYEGCFYYMSVIISTSSIVALSLSFVSINALTYDYTDYYPLQNCLDSNSNILIDNFIASNTAFKTWLAVAQSMAGISIILIIAELFIWCKLQGSSINERNIQLVVEDETIKRGVIIKD